MVKSTEDELVALNFDHIVKLHLFVKDDERLLKVDGKIYSIDYETWHEVARMMRFQWSKLL
jgi:hypothetical protein